MSKGKIIVALDVNSTTEALRWIDLLGDRPWAYKIGLQLFVREGVSAVAAVKATRSRVFLDLKFHDIPNTVCEAVRSAAQLGVDLASVHLGGGPEMLAAAAEGAAGSRTMLLGISVLTSSTRETLRAVGVEDDVPDQVLRLSHLAVANGIGGIVASPHEIDLLRQSHRDRLFIVTPGVRPLWAAANDQKRMMTPGEAVAKGADALVIGRPITAAPDPVESLRRIEAEIEQEIAEGASDE